MSGFNYPNSSSQSEILIPPNVQYAISVDGVYSKVLPVDSNPYVVYRIGDGTVHSEGWENILGNKYLDFYLSSQSGIQGEKGDTGEQGNSINDVTINMLNNGELPTTELINEVLTMNIPIGDTGLQGATGEAGLTYRPEFTLDASGNLYVEYIVESGLPDETIDGGAWA